MKKSIKLLSIFLICIADISTISAQTRVSQVGLRVGYPFGFTFRTDIGNQTMFEGIVGSRGNSISFTGLVEVVIRPAERPELEMYFGGGGHIGFYGDKSPYWEKNEEAFIGVGIDGILGLGWNFKNAPVNLTFDYKPAFNIVGPKSFWFADAAISARYMFGDK